MASKSQPGHTSTQLTSEHFVKPKTSDSTKYLFTLYRIAGILAPNRFKRLYAVYSFVFNGIIIILLPLMFILSYVLRSDKLRIQEFSSSLRIFFGISSCEMKFVAIIYLRPYLFKIEAILDKLDARIQNSAEISEVEKTVRFGNRTVIVYTIIYYAFSASTCIGSILTGWPTCSLYIPYVNWRKSTFELVISNAIEFALMNAAIVHQLINDTYAIVYSGILRSHLKILIMRVRRIGDDPRCMQEDNLRELVRCLHDHKNLIELINTIGAVVSTTYFIMFLSTTSLMGATLINITISNEKYTLVGSALYTLCIIIEILPICYIANGLAAESDRLPEVIFHMNWMDQSREFQRLCLFFMHRSQKTIVFYAGKMFTISLNTFVSIIKFTFSVYTLLNNMNFANRFIAQ